MLSSGKTLLIAFALVAEGGMAEQVLAQGAGNVTSSHGAHHHAQRSQARSAGHVQAKPRSTPDSKPLQAKAEEISVSVAATSRAAHNIDRETHELQKVPQASTRIDAKELRAEHITALPQATRLLPTVQLNISNPRNTAINIRGLGAAGTAATDGIEGGVAVYVDDVYRSRPGTALTDLPDMNGITVLRGPSGTEGGMVTTAGAISLTTAAPDLHTRHVYGEAGVGNFNYNRWNLGVTTPIIKDKLAIRLSGLGYGYDGWVKNLDGGGDTGGQTSRAFRAQVLAHPTDEISVRIIGDYSHLRENCCNPGLVKGSTTRSDGQAWFAGSLAQRSGWTGYTPYVGNGYTVDRNSTATAEQEDIGLSGHIDWHHNNFTLSSITAYRWWNWWPSNDGDLNGINAVTQGNAKVNQNQFTQEFRFSSSLGKLLDYRVGAFYMWQENRVYSDQAYGDQMAQWAGYGMPGGSSIATTAQANNALNGYNVRSYDQPTTNYYAAYANGTWHVHPKIDIVTGVRYNYAAKTGSFAQWQIRPSSYSSAVTPLSVAQTIWNTYGSNGTADYGAHVDNGFVTGQFVVNYKLTDNVIVYARYARGGKSGGLNLTSFNASQRTAGAVTPNVGKETDDAFEVGSKASLLDNRLLVSGALYQTNDHNYQVTATHEYQGALVSYLSSAPKVRVRGAEADIHYSPIVNLITSLSASYNDAQFLEYSTGAPPEVITTGAWSMNHTQVPFVPRWALSAAVQYSHSVGHAFRSSIDGYVGGSYNYNTRMNTSANNSSYGWVQAYGTLNLNFGFRDHSGRWDFQGFINNATDERRISQLSQGGGMSGNGAWYAYVTQPRSFGFIARANY
ncbi:TonB-dependent receptor [Acetobacter okinawensis]|uniref:TonB-dependent receptor n=1 Tax=Acetobacter okinawensis TaxID=1076594 RepID=UPI00209FDB59|nr:TonB-dependent receptor [Acetobacter okinawensis]MCP1213678.1 TonB-dependent receptor [Acetobacter okinawensis]